MASHSKKKYKNAAQVTQFGSRTDVGCVRDHNEDSLVVAPPLFAVCDGMGGHEAGEVASEIAIEVLSDLAPSVPDPDSLRGAVIAANSEIIKAAQTGRGREGMGTTCTAAIVKGERIVIAQVGDSRAYLLTDGHLQQLTRDHSLVADMVESGQMTKEQARTAPNRSIITRALGTAPDTQPDLYEINVKAGDRLLICSDGLSGMLQDDEIEDILKHVSEPQRCASMLVSDAITAGGLDNVTVIVADVAGEAEKKRKKIARKTKITAAIILIILAVIIGGAVYGANYWINRAAFLGEDEGYVAVYRGVPGTFLGFSFNKLDHSSNIQLDKLNPGVASRIRENAITTDSVQAADDILDEYRAELAGEPIGKNTTSEAQENTTNNNATSNGAANGSAGTNNSATSSAANNNTATSNNAQNGSAGNGGAANGSAGNGGAANSNNSATNAAATN